MSISSNVAAADGESPSAFVDQLSVLERRVTALEHAQASPRLELWPPPNSLIEEIKQITRAMFGGTVIAEFDVDPSEPDDPWMNFRVPSNLEWKELSPLQQAWHERVARLGVHDPTRYRLLICRS